MRVDEMIETLRRFPPGSQVVVDGYEGGFDEPYMHALDVAPANLPSRDVGIFGAYNAVATQADPRAVCISRHATMDDPSE